MTYAQAMAVAAQVSTLSVDPPSGATTIDGSSNPTIFEVSGTVKCSGVSITASSTRIKLEPTASYLLMAHVRPYNEPTVVSGTTDTINMYFYNATTNTEIESTSPQNNKVGGTQIQHSTSYLRPFQHKEMGPYILTALVKSSDIPSTGLEIEIRADITSTSTDVRTYTFDGNSTTSWSRSKNYITITQV